MKGWWSIVRPTVSLPPRCIKTSQSTWRAFGRLPESTLYTIINKLQGRDNMPSHRCVVPEFVRGGWWGCDDWRGGSTEQSWYLCRNQGENRQTTSCDASFQPSAICRGCRFEHPYSHSASCCACDSWQKHSVIQIPRGSELLSAAEYVCRGRYARNTPTMGQSLTLYKVSIHSISLGSITGMLVSATSFSAQTQRKRRGSFLISTRLLSVKMQPRLPVLMTMTRLLRR